MSKKKRRDKKKKEREAKVSKKLLATKMKNIETKKIERILDRIKRGK